MMRLSPQLLIVTASAFVGVGENAADHTEGGLIDRFFRSGSKEGDAARREWDVALIQHCGYWSHFDHRIERSSWPVSEARTPNDLGVFGLARGILVDQPESGDIFLQFSPSHQDFLRAGIVVRVCGHGVFARNRSYVDLLTIEGDTDESGRFGQGKAMRLARRLSPSLGDRFLRWADLDGLPLASRSRPVGTEIVPRKDIR
ncbi:MAG: hypothetical protein JWL61_2334 [Gemmatimonadetes bacterium]|nr:hypothetical protein [Gemmatimonadota bacterium]